MSVLEAADVIAAEDTRRLRTLVSGLGLTTHARVVSYYDAVERQRIPSLLSDLAEGRMVVLVTDAGTPVVSDPGYRLIDAALDAGHEVTAIPGPSAVLMALTLSGLPTDRFCFEGFLPRRGQERRIRLAAMAVEPRTMVLFESPQRLAATLQDLAQVIGPERMAAICRELTKVHEEVIRGSLAELVERVEQVRGEITLVIEGAPETAPPTVTDTDLVAQVRARTATGEPTSAAIAAVARAAGRPRREVYDLMVAAKDSDAAP